MTYKIHEIAAIAGISTRTLRYYDRIGLLQPTMMTESGYRLYDETSINQLQLILLYKELGFALQDIVKYVQEQNSDFISILSVQREKIVQRKLDLDIIIQTIDQTILYHKGEIDMTNNDKFNGLKEETIRENEDKYGDEIRLKYGDEIVDASYQKLRKMSQWQWDEAERLGKEILTELPQAMVQGPTSDEAMLVCKKHQQWIQLYWPKYDQNAHLNLVKMYTEDDRFKAYYEKVKIGAADFLYEAMKVYLKQS